MRAPPPPQRRAHRGAQCYPRPWTSGLFLSELAQTATSAPTSSPRSTAGSSATPAPCTCCPTPTSPPSPSTPSASGRPDRHPVAARAVRGRRSRQGATALTLEVRVSNVPAQELYRRFGFVPAGARTATTRPTLTEPVGEDALVMWAHDIDQPDFRAPPRRHRRRRAGHHHRGRRRIPRRGPDDVAARIETSCDETAAVGRGRRHRRCCRRSCRARSTCTPATAASCPRSPAGPTSTCSRRSSPRRWSRPGSTPARHRRRGRHGGPGLIGSLLVGRLGGQGAGAGVGQAVRRRQPPRGPPLRRVPRRARRSSCRSSCCWCRVATR